MERKLRFLLSAVVAVAVGAGVGTLYDRYVRHARPNLPPPAWTVDRGIEEAADYVVRATDGNGRYVYLMAQDGGVASSEYNIVRHAGAIYALAEYQTQGATAEARARAAAATSRAAAQMLDPRYTRPVGQEPDMLAVWSDPKEEGGNRWSAKLGGSGLGLVGLMSRVRADDAGASDLESIQKIARFVVFMQKPDGNFNAKYSDEEGRVTGASLYYPGEAVLGLTMLHEQDHDPAWLKAGFAGIAARGSSIRATDKPPADHWLMIAIDRILPFVAQAPSPAKTREELFATSIHIGRSMLDEQTRTASRSPELDGCYTPDGRTTPSATRLEGLLALEHMLGEEPSQAAFRDEVRRSIVRGMTFLRRAQITDGPRRGGFPPTVKEDDGTPAPANEDEEHASRRRGDVRIDYVQHAMSAMMHYRQMCARTPGVCP